jgi:hypothetical protein
LSEDYMMRMRQFSALLGLCGKKALWVEKVFVFS